MTQRSAALISLLIAMAGFLTPMPVQAQELNITTSLFDAPGGMALAGDNFRYRVTYACNLVVGDCENATVVIDLPPEVEFVPPAFFPPGDVASGAHDGSPLGGTVTFTFQATVPAGHAGDLDITVRFPNGSTPDGTTTTMNTDAVTSMGDPPLVTQMADLPPVTSSASPMADIDVALQHGFLDSCQSPGPPGAFPSTYQVSIGPSAAAGSLDFVDVAQLVLTLPVGVTSVVPMDGGIYNAIANTVTWTGLGTIAVGSAVTVSVELNFPQPTFIPGQMVTATANALVDVLDAPVDPTLVPFGPLDFVDTLTVFEETTEATVAKRFADGRAASLPPAEGQDFAYNVAISNTGNFPLDTLTVIDDGDGALADVDAGIDITMVTTGAYSPAPTSVTINVTGDLGSTPSITSPNGMTDTLLDLTLGGMLMAGERVIRIEWVFNGGSPVGMAPSSEARVDAIANVGFPVGTLVDNHVTASWTASPTMPSPCGGVVPPTSGSDTDNFPYTVSDSYTYLNPSKNEVSAGPYFPGDIVSFSFDVTNDVLANDPASGVVVTDLLPEFLEFQTGTEVENFALAPGVSLAMPLEVVANYNGTGRTLLRWTLSGDLDPGETVEITFDTEVLVGVTFGTLTNTMGMTYPASIEQICAGSSAADPADLDGDTDTSDILCSAGEGVEIAAVAQLPSSKFVQGQCDPSFLAAPGPGTTLPGGVVDWRVEVSNAQTVPMGNFVLIDILPFVGDTGVRDLTPRLSLFRPLLIEPITPPPGGTVFYSLSGNPCRPEVGGPTSGCDAPGWTPIPPTPITDTRAIKVEFGGLVLNPLDVLEFSWRMTAPADAPTDGSEAFNSFAFGSNRQDDGGFLGAEPNKVGIDATCAPVAPDDAMLGDFVWLDADGDGIQDGGLEVGINDVPVQLFDPGSDGLPRTGDDVLVLSSITADDALGNPGWYKFSALSPGDYYVQFTPPANFEVTLQGVGGGATDSDTDPISACTDVVTLAASEVNLDVDMGLLAPVTASLGNYVWFDGDGDGVQNEAATDGINGVAVKLFADDGDGTPEPGADDGVPLQVAVTADDTFGNPGFYLFEGLTPGVPYFVQFMLPPTATGFTTRNAGGNDTVDSDANLGNGTSQVVTLAAGELNPTVDAGLTPVTGTLSLGNVVWMDDGDDVFDPLSADMPLNGVRVNLYLDTSGDGLPQVNEYFGSTVTATLAGKNGRYRFGNLTAGDYIVEIPASNFAAGEPLAGKTSVPFSTVDPNDDVDHDDAGDSLGTVVVSVPISLSNDGEPTPDADDDLEDDDNVNFTLDFGFVVGTVADYDFGDNPDAGGGTAQGNYETVVFDGGAFHELIGPTGPYLGDCVDSDNGTQQSFAADADDLGGASTVTHGACSSAGDDEDGVSFSTTLLAMGGSVDVTTSSSSGISCLINGFVDWNRDGNFLGAGEQILTDASTGLSTIAVPATAVPGITYARFRCSSAGGDGPTGFSPDGEVEDYRLQVMGADWGDAPNTYGTMMGAGGPFHDTDPNIELYLGACVDTESDGQPVTFPLAANGDDTMLGSSRIGDCVDDENGITFDTMLIRGQMAQVTATASVPDPSAGLLDAWIDFDGSGTFDHPAEHLFAGVSQSLATGSNSLPVFVVPATAVPGVTYARFRLSSGGSLLPGGMASDGEVEDYEVVIKGFDFGDLPDATYPTELASSGAQHVVDPASTLYLGNCADPEDDGAPSALADGDDLGADNGQMDTGTAGTCGANDDEDGVVFNTMIVACQTAQITVDANAAGRLDAWIDFDPTTSAGFDVTDQIVTNMALAAGNTVLNVPVPCTADVNTVSYARFRFSSVGGLAETGLAMDGEVEDYTVFLKGSDFGDAPDSYDTTDAAGGPKHGIDPRSGNEFLLGACADTELDGPAAGTAVQDDGSVATSTAGTCTVANDDEDGITFGGGMAMAGACTTSNALAVTLLNNASVATPRLDAWIDWNGDGDFDVAEHLFGGTSAVLTGASTNLTYDVPCDAVPQTVSYARFRLSSTGGLLPGGGALDGEVEDYAFQVKGVDFGDAPDTYGTTLTATLGDASHTIVPGFSLGGSEDTESNGQPTAGADGDGVDEDGVSFAGGMAMAGACSTANGVDIALVNTAGLGAAFVNAWVDWNDNDVFDHPAEHLFGGTSQALSSGVNNLTYDVPCDAVVQATSYARFRLSSAGSLQPTDGVGIDPVADGEVEDYVFQVKGIDFGDAPDTYGTTLGSILGDASHTIVPGYSLGAAEDTESDGQPTAGADGDGVDEDGVAFAEGMAMAGACSTGNSLDVTLTNTAGIGAALLDAWIDWNANDVFDDPSEHLFDGTSAALTGAVTTLTYDVPCDAVPQLVSYARFRLSSAGSLSPTDGVGADPVANGEVEDYTFQVKGVDFGDAPDTYGTTQGSTLGDASHTIVPGFNLGATEDSESDGQPNATADGDGVDEDGVVFAGGMAMAIACSTGNTVDVTLTNSAALRAGLLDAWIDFNGNGVFDHPAEHLFSPGVGTSVALASGVNSLTYDVPCSALEQTVSYARFRLSSAGGLPPTDGADADPVANGEVEDFVFQVKGADFGDAPDTYGTTIVGNGAAHGVDPATPFHLGACIDTDLDGVPATPPANAVGDDTTAGATTVGSCVVADDDEDGVTFTSMLIACEDASVDVTVTGAAGLLDAWIDFDGSGAFDDPTEHLFGGASEPVTGGGTTDSLTFNVPCAAVPGNTYARFRLSASGGLGPDGSATDGEVEDYQVLVKGSDLGDNPDSYVTLFGSDGPRHGVDPALGLYLGVCVDTEADGQVASGDATDDDSSVGTSTVGSCSGNDDEDGVVFDTLVTACKSATITVTASAPGLLDAWIDFDADGGFDPGINPAGDQIFASEPLVAGANSLTFLVPCSAADGDTFSRFRLSSAGGLSFDGPALDGEVEDYQIRSDEADLGDAPDSYSTTFGAGGALHGLDPAADLYLGTCVDSEVDGQPSVNADGDDTGVGPTTLGTCTVAGDDEDGVSFDTMIIACQQAQVTVTASNVGLLDAWIDLDGDGTFSGASDQIFTSQPLTGGGTPDSLTFNVPCDLAPGASYARFRLSSSGGLGFGGTTPDGEVEDYAVTVKGADLGDAPDGYQTTFGAGGPHHGVDPASPIYLGACVDTERDGQPAMAAEGDDVGLGTSVQGVCVADDEDGISFDTDVNVCLNAEITVTASAVGQLDAWIDFDGDGTFSGPNDQIFASQAVVAGSNTLTFAVPCDAIPGDSYARFRYSSSGGLPFGGPAMNGEVEDYALLIKGFDFGDAPDPAYPTLFASDGARHVVLTVNNPTLGALADIETEGQQSADHLGDDNDGVDDEDGVTFTGLLVPGAPASLDVVAGTTGGILNAWIDYNGDGDWSDAGEQVAVDFTLGANVGQTLNLMVPSTASVGETCARFRFSSTGGLLPTGQALDGEVEDYALDITAEDSRIGLSKEIIDVQRMEPGASYDVTFLMLAENLGNIRIHEIQVISDLATAFAEAASFEVVMVDSSDFAVNPAFDGQGDPNMLTGMDSLDPAESGEIMLVINVVPAGNVGPYECSAIVEGLSDADTPVSDVSQDGGDPDPDGDGDPSEDDPTVVIFDLPPIEIPTLGPWGLSGLIFFLMILGVRRLGRRRDLT